MGHGKESPRQKMIGMMYLVLTALLALNVSADVLNAFILVDNSLKKTSVNFNKKNTGVYADFETKYETNKEAVGPWKNKAEQVKKWTQDLFDKLEGYKKTIVTTAEGPQGDINNIQAKSDNNVPGQIMILQGEGDKLKEEFVNYRKNLIDLIDNKTRYKNLIDGLNAMLNTDDPPLDAEGIQRTWASQNFDHLPLIAVIAMLSKMQTDVRNAEGDILGYLYEQIDAGSFKFNKIEAIVRPKNGNYILVGGSYEAEVFIAASDSTQTPVIKVGNTPMTNVKGGKGIYKASATSVGIKKWGGVIELKNPATEEIMQFKYNAEYQVAAPSMVVSPTKMNVFYIGVANPVAISVSGMPDNKVNATISAGSIVKGGNGKYTVRVRRPGNVSVNVSAKMDNGSTKNMGSMPFRVKTVPDPIAKVAGKTGGGIRKNLLVAQMGVVADLPNFDFNLKFNIIGFTVSTTIKGYEESEASRSYRFTPKQKALLRKVRPGKKVYIEDIKAKGPDGTIRKLPTISFRLQ